MKVFECIVRGKHRISVLVTLSILFLTNAQLAAQWSEEATENDSIVVKSGNQTQPTIISDGNGGAVIVWQDAQGGGDIFGARLKSSGTLSTLFKGDIATLAGSSQLSPKMAANGQGEAFVVWQDNRSIVTHIYAQKIDVLLGFPSGANDWPVDGVLVQKGNNYFLPNVIRDGVSGAIVASYTLSDGKFRIDFQKLNNSGEMQWDQFTRVSANIDAPTPTTPPEIISDENRGVISVWSDQRDDTLRVFAARLDEAGKPAWADVEIAVSESLKGGTGPAIVSDGAGGVIIVWIAPRAGSSDDEIQIQRLDSDGSRVWGSSGPVISETAGAKMDVRVVRVNSDTLAAVWIDLGSGLDKDIRIQRFDQSGNEIGQELDIVSAIGDQVNPVVVANKRDGFIVAWEDSRSAQTDIYAQLIDPNGQLSWGTNGLAVSSAPGIQTSPVLVDDGLGGAIIVFEDDRGVTGNDIYAQRVSRQGVLGEFRNITITVPDTNTIEWEIGSRQAIQWTFRGDIDNVSIELSRDGGKTYKEDDVIAATTPNSQNAIWDPVTEPASDSCRIRISAANADFIYDISNQNFKIIQPEAPVVVPQVVTQGTAGQSLEVTTRARDESGIGSALLHYRRGGEVSFSSLEMTATGGDSFKAAIPTNFVTERGVEYFVSATDNIGFADSSKIFFVTVNFNSNTQTTAISSGPSQNAYRMISAPNDLDNPSIMNSLSASGFGAVDSTSWRVFLYDSGRYVELDSARINDPRFTFKAGQAFWMISNAARTVTLGSGTSLPTNEPYTVLIKPGWNQVSTPFAFTVSWQTALDSTGQSSSLNPPFLFEGSYRTAATLAPYKGYFVFNNSGQSINLRIPPVEASAGTLTLQKERELSQTGWEVQINARCQEARDDFNFIGIDEQASQYWDAKDFPEPPPIGEYISLYFPREDWKEKPNRYTTDFRNDIGLGQTWSFKARTNIANAEAQLEFMGLDAVPADLGIWVFDEKLNIKQNLVENRFYSFPTGPNGTLKSLKLIVGTKAYLSGNFSDLDFIPKTFELSQNFPNPFNPTTTIRYGLPRAEKVRIIIYDVLGRKVRTLLNDEPKEPGFHLVTWNGQDNGGRQVASGLYVFRLQAGDFSQTRKMVLVK